MEFAASLIAVVGLADKVISRCHRYLSAVKGCPSDLRTILLEISSIKAVIENLEFLRSNSPDPHLKQLLLSLDGADGPVQGCRECLQQLENLIPDDKTQGSWSKRERPLQPTLERLAWPLHATKAKRLLDELGRFRGSISLTLVTDTTYVTTHHLTTCISRLPIHVLSLRRLMQTMNGKLKVLCDQMDSRQLADSRDVFLFAHRLQGEPERRC